MLLHSCRYIGGRCCVPVHGDLMLKLNPRRCEVLSDSILGLLVVLPPFTLIALMYDCGHLDGRDPVCSSPALQGIASFLQGMILLTAFGGFVVYLPIVIGAYINSTRYKYRAWKAGTLRKLSFTFIIWLITTCFVGLIVAAIVVDLLAFA